jgi:exodeoxyribonuclease III
VLTGKELRVCTWNINGIMAATGKNELQNFLAKEDPDVLCLNEIKIDEDKLKKEGMQDLFPKSYNFYWNCCKSKGGCAGTAIFSKIKPLNVTYDIGIAKHDQEGRTITAEYEKFFLVATYIPNAGQKLDRLGYRTAEWDPDFRNYLKELEAKGKPVVWCGDLNVSHHEIDISNAKGNLKSAGFTIEERAEFTKLLDMGFTDTFRKLYPTKVSYSYWSARGTARKENKGWRLDYFVVSNSFFPAVVNSEMLPDVMGSDHCPLKLTLDLTKGAAPTAEDKPTKM